MKKNVLFLCAFALAAAGPAGVDHWTAQQLKEDSQALAGKLKDGLASQTLAKWGNHLVMIVHREATGQSEFHETQADIIIVRSGSGSIITGGSVEGGKTTAPGEIRGTGIKGGQKQALHTGDVVHIPPKTPHQVILGAGEKIEYLAVKVDAQ
jgi:mannose-6-phosphate isomerase-like protein (cupin superfamily)